MKLSDVFAGLNATLPAREIEVTGLCMDSREAKPGNIFFAVSGFHTDGSLFIGEAVVKGCKAVVVQHGQGPSGDEIGGAPIIVVDDIHQAMSLCANNFFSAPSRRVEVLGITGTNGKTTTSYFIESIYRAAGIKPGVIGTVNYRCGGEVIAAAVNTTPPALKLQECMAMMAGCGCKTVIMEVSSHSLAYNRVKDMDFDGAVFTNFSQDHLDFHKTMENYLADKTKLFQLLAAPSNSKKNRTVVINGDEPSCETVLKVLPPDVKVWRFGTGERNDWRVSDIEVSLGGTDFTISSPHGSRRIKLKLWGGYNVFNAVAAMACACSRGIPFESAVAGVMSLERVPGRMEPVNLGQPFHVFVDFAHTERALENVLKALALFPHKRVFTVFGCGGNRDRTKRGPMAAVVCSNCSHAYITLDNPRIEAPEQIFADMERGLKDRSLSNYTIIRDRAAAVTEALRAAGEGDIVLLAGKGHEIFQLINGQRIPYSDTETAVSALKELQKAAK